jgi:hypothetical protein
LFSLYSSESSLPIFSPATSWGGNVPEATVIVESEAADTVATPELDNGDEEEAQYKASHTKNSSIDLGLCNPSLTPEVCLDSGVTTPAPEAPNSFAPDEQILHIQELQGEVSSLMKQLLVSLGKSKHVVDYDKNLQDTLIELTRPARVEKNICLI